MVVWWDCPTNIQVYINEHRPAEGTTTGFMASEDNCMMLVITDGGNYDSTGLDSRVIDPPCIGLVEECITRDPADDAVDDIISRPRGGGGGAVGISDAMLLIAVIALLLTATARNRRRKQTTSIS